MKHFVILFCFLACMNFVVFAQEDAVKKRMETWWLSAGFTQGNYFNRGTGMGDFYSISSGFNINVYGFFNQKNIGFFLSDGCMFPVIYNNETDYEAAVHIDYIAGVGFRHKIHKCFDLHFGIGPAVSVYVLNNRVNDKFSDHRIEFGLGGDIGLKYNLAYSLYIDIGTAVSYAFAAYQVVKTAEESKGWINHSFFGIRPYIALGSDFSVIKQHRGTAKFID